MKPNSYVRLVRCKALNRSAPVNILYIYLINTQGSFRKTEQFFFYSYVATLGVWVLVAPVMKAGKYGRAEFWPCLLEMWYSAHHLPHV